MSTTVPVPTPPKNKLTVVKPKEKVTEHLMVKPFEGLAALLASKA